MAAGMSNDADPPRLVAGLGTRWTLAETSFKFHASCRHTHPSADALLALMREHRVAADDIAEVMALVHQGAIDVLGRVVVPQTVHQAKFSMGTVLGLVAELGHAGLDEFDQHFLAPRVAAFRDRVAMQLDREVDTAYPKRWIGKVQVRLRDGKVLEARVDEPKGDPGNTLSRPELEDKARRLAAYGAAATPEEMDSLIESVWRLEDEPRMGRVFSR
jgi:2-methylcitrate dehydratase PrpD